MYRYYITRKTPEGVMEYPTTTAPNVIESYGQNGSQFEGFAERFWGYVEFEKELPGSDLDAYGLVPGPSPEYHPINENMARRAKEMMSFSEYVPGSATWDYRLQVDKASMVAQRQKQRTRLPGRRIFSACHKQFLLSQCRIPKMLAMTSLKPLSQRSFFRVLVQVMLPLLWPAVRVQPSGLSGS